MTALAWAREAGFARNGEPVFAPVSLSLEPGQVIVLTGRNGAGKTTLLRMLAGIIEPARGRCGLAADCNFVGHLPAVKNDLSCRENLAFERALGPPGASVPEALARVGLAGYGRRPARNLSAGQRRRLGLARLLVRETPVWLLDEPYASLDDDGCRIVDELIEARAVDGGVILATHQRLPKAGPGLKTVELAPDRAGTDPDAGRGHSVRAALRAAQ